MTFPPYAWRFAKPLIVERKIDHFAPTLPPSRDRIDPLRNQYR